MWKKTFLCVLLLGMCWTFTGLFTHALQCGDETRVAGISQSVFQDGAKIIPLLNGQPFLEYPPLFYQAQSVTFDLFGDTEFSTSVLPVICALLTVFLLYALARRVKIRQPLALFTAFLCMSCSTFLANCNTCRVDIMLTMFVLLAVYGGVFAGTAENKLDIFWGTLVCTAGIAGGLLTKGILGAVLPISILGSTVFFSDVCHRHISFKCYCLLAVVAIVGFIPLLVWYWLVYKQGGYDAFYEACIVNNFGRFGGSQGDHVEPFTYYFKHFPELFAPYFIFAIWAVVLLFRRIFKGKFAAVSERDIFMLCAFLVPFTMFFISAAKRLVYLLPLAPFVALLAMTGLRQLLDLYSRRKSKKLAAFFQPHQRLVVSVLCGVGLAVSVIMFFVAGHMARKNSARPAFEECARWEAQGKKIVLVAPVTKEPVAHLSSVFGFPPPNAVSIPIENERMRGAAVFYLKHAVVTQTPEQANPLIDSDVWVVRAPAKKIGKSFPAKIFLLTTVSEKKSYLEAEQNRKCGK